MSPEKKNGKSIGLAIVGGGKVGRIRGGCARNYPGVEWIGVCDIDEKVGKKLTEDLQADFFTTDYKELLKRPEVNTSIIATFENEHVDPILASLEQGHDLMLEKPLATNAVESAKILKTIEEAGVDAVVGYTQRFRRRFLIAKEKVRTGELGEITSVTTRAFMNRAAPMWSLGKTEYRTKLTPMVVSGTHSLDISLWIMGDKKPVELYARAVNKTLGSIGTQDATFGIFTFEDGSIWSMSMSWALPTAWPASTYSLEVGIVGTEGVLTIDDTHRDIVLATERTHSTHRAKEEKNVSFLESYPPGDISMGGFWGPMREETTAWLTRLYMGIETPHATAAEGHRNLVLTKAMDLAAKRGKVLSLPVDPEELEA
ncbi:Gfo/Idh/MocA family protein [Nitrospinota bacterium]